MRQLDIIHGGGVAIKKGKIVGVGESNKIKQKFKAKKRIDARGMVMTPGLVDPHTHLVFAGTREQELALRLGGASYKEISAAGGGIMSTVREVRKAKPEQLKSLALRRMDQMITYGTTTAEAKSGYGLTLLDEIKILKVIRDLNRSHQLELIPTFMGAHVVPEEYTHKREDFINELVKTMLPEIAKRRLARFCDVFCEEGAFDIGQTRKILNEGKRYGLIPKLHADEFTHTGGAELAAELGACSADHLCKLSEEGIRRLKDANTVAVLLPVTSLFMGIESQGLGRRLIDGGVAVALGSDFNPGTSPTFNLQLVMSLGCLLYKMYPEEVIVACTINAAHACGCAQDRGSIEPGKIADLLIWRVHTYTQIPYFLGQNLILKVIKKGRICLTGLQVANNIRMT
jgi:imidazolonepropionase